MSLFSSTVKFISDRKKIHDAGIEEKESPIFPEQELELDFSLRNYAKESFSVLIVKPLSKCMQKIIRGVSFIITGILSGAVIALIFCGILLQFSSVENSIISSLVVNKLEKLFDDADLSIKSAMINWNRETNSIELNFKKVRIDDLRIQRLTIIPDYAESFKQHKLVAKTISILKPKIAIDIADDFKKISFNPNLEKGNTNKAFFEPISYLHTLKDAFSNTHIEIINADVVVLENGQQWNFKNLYCDYSLQENAPNVIDCSIVLPGQQYPSGIKIVRLGDSSKPIYNVKLHSVNPLPIHNAFARRNATLEKLMTLINGYNLPVSGDLKLSFNHDKLLDCKFDLSAATGCIKLPNRNTLSLNLGKRIDSGNISGVISSEKMLINSININYGNSGLQLTGMTVPMSDYKFLDVVNIDGTLSLTNIDIREMETILPKSISKSVIPTFKTYLPGFKLELFRIDINGPIAFGNRMNSEKLAIGQGVFKVHDAKIPVGDHVVTNVSATGNVTPRGIDIKLTDAMFGNTKINSGVFFISNEDNSWIGNVNADVTVDDISAYSKEISAKLASLPIEKLKIKGIANLDMKLVRIVGDKLHKKDLPFRIVKGEGIVKSSDNTNNLKLSWNDNELSVIGDISTKKNNVHIKINENFAQKIGTGEYHFKGNSDFLSEFLPKPLRYFSGNFDLDLTNSWGNGIETFDVSMNLKDTIISIPALGDIKTSKEDGTFKTHVSKYDDKLILSKLVLNTKDTKISGQITFDKDGDISECVLNDFNINGCSAKVNLLKKNSNNMILSIVGDSMDLNRIIYTFNRFNKDVKISTYLNLQSLGLSSSEQMKNVKGTIDVINSNIVGGSCIGVLGENTTVALTSKNIPETNDCLISISASNAGDLLKYIGLTDTVSGGNISFVIKSSISSKEVFTGAFEINDFLVKNNPNMNKAISLSSAYGISGAADSVVGFNSCIGNIFVSKNLIKFEECKIIGPMMSISCKGEYDRINDDFKSSGILLPAHSLMNNHGARGALVANCRLSGPLGMLSVSVDPLKFMANESLLREFGNLIPIIDAGYENANICPSNSNDDLSDPFTQKAFDNEESTKPKEGIKKLRIKKKPKKRIDKKFGVTISRGLHT